MKHSPSFNTIMILRPDFFSLIYGNFFSDLGSGEWGDEKKKSSEINWSFSEFFFKFSRTNSKTSKVNQYSVLNL